MRDADCAAFLHWAAPRLGLRFEGFRRVRRQVCKRVVRRLVALGLDGVASYERYLHEHPEEWAVLDQLCFVHVSRFYRDRAVWDGLRDHALPALAREARHRVPPRVCVWSAGCAAGEEPYTVAVLWRAAIAGAFPDVAVQIIATEVDDETLGRARRACYLPSSLKELPPDWRREAFTRRDGLVCLHDDLASMVELRREDLRTSMPDGPFDLVLCRNLAFTYFDGELRDRVARGLVSRLAPGGLLVVGKDETPDVAALGLVPHPRCPMTYRRAGAQD